MPSHFGLTIRFLAPVFHGRRGDGVPEWPPSPLRAFQALVAGASTACRGKSLQPRTRAALEWLASQPPPALVAPAGVPGSGYRLSVPHNAMDLVARARSRGSASESRDANPATHRTMKLVRPMWLMNGDSLHYLWSLPESVTDDVRGHIEVLDRMARSVVALGWGIDIVAAQAGVFTDDEADALAGERWLPNGAESNDGLRVPVPGTLADLDRRYDGFLRRIGPAGFTPPPPLSVFKTIAYRRATDPSHRPVVAFSIAQLDGHGFRPFDTARRALTVVGMTRHAVKLAAEVAGWSEAKIRSVVLGHAEQAGNPEHIAVGPGRFAYLPVPSIEARGSGSATMLGSVRRLMITSFDPSCEPDIRWAEEALGGRQLVDEDRRKPVAVLVPLPTGDNVIRRYVSPAASWATVTPVVLPGYDDPAHYRRRLHRGTSAEEQKQLLGRLARRIDALLRKAIMQAGFADVLARYAEIEWRSAGFWPGAELSGRYGVPDHLRRFPRLHVRLRWRDAQGGPVRAPGPICLGGGRYLGVGLFAAEPEDRS